MSNRFIPFSSGTDMNQVLAILNKNFGELDNEAVTKVFNVAGGKPGFIEGKLPNSLGYGFILYDGDKAAIACYIDSSGNPILKIAKDGYDATTATNDQLIFNSSQNTFKIALTGTATIPAVNTGDSDFVSVTHNLGFIPGVQAYAFYNGTSYYPLPSVLPSVVTGEVLTVIQPENITSTTVEFWVYRGPSATVPATLPPTTIKYYLLQETAS